MQINHQKTTRINGVLVELTLPKVWGNPKNVVEKQTGEDLQTVIWEKIDFHIRNNWIWRHLNLATIEDKTDGFDIDCVRYFIFCSSDNKILKEKTINLTIEWLEKRFQEAYDELSVKQKRLAKL